MEYHFQLIRQLANGKMFTFRFKSYRFSQYLAVALMVLVSSGAMAGQTQKKCAEFNEYVSLLCKEWPRTSRDMVTDTYIHTYRHTYIHTYEIFPILCK